MTELDGVWKVERVSGALPPMVGIWKRISGASGETRLGRLPGVRFRVVGHSLRYRPPLAGLVDHLEPDGAGFRGRATLLGRELGRFRMTRMDTATREGT